MKHNNSKFMAVLLATFACLAPLHSGPGFQHSNSNSADKPDMPSSHPATPTQLPPPLKRETVLDARGESVNKRDIYYSYGTHFLDTRVFYEFPNHTAVLCVKIGNSNLEFPVSARLHVFAKGTKGEEIKQWISNQHSDLILPAPMAETTYVIPTTSLSEKHEFVEVVKARYGEPRPYFR